MRRWITLCLSIAACEGASADPGLDALLFVSGAQFVEGDLPSDGGGPAVTGIDNNRNSVRIGETGKPLGGALASNSASVLIGLRGDRGHWIVVPGPPDPSTPDSPSFAVELSFSTAIEPGPLEVLVAAVDMEGRVGATRVVALVAENIPLPSGAFVVRLSWDTNADLDLHVIDAQGIEIWARNPTSYVADAAAPPNPAAIARAGRLDVDSNATCVIDGRRVEQVIWTQTPTAGVYRARVDTPSLCEESAARWTVEVFESGVRTALSRGTSTAFDTRFPHDAGAGVLALEHEVRRP